ncbi:MAG: response regulator [Candidatus Saccharimonadales bacterium]
MSKILLVEDDNNLREIYEARLQAEGYVIASAKDGEEALVVAKAEKPDLIISDVMMPKISGFEMLDILRNTPELKDTKVVMLTALGQAEDQNRASHLGADRYLVKSQVTLEDIVKVAHELMGDSASDQEAPATATQAVEPTVDPSPPVEQPVSPAPVEQPASPGPVEPVNAPKAEEPSLINAAMPPVEPVSVPPEPPVEQAAAPASHSDEISIDSSGQLSSSEDASSMPSSQPTSQEPAMPASTMTMAPEMPKSPMVDAAQAANDQTLNQAVNDLMDESTPSPLPQPTAPFVTTDAGATTQPEPTAPLPNNQEENVVGGRKIITPLDQQPQKSLDELLAIEESTQPAAPQPVSGPVAMDPNKPFDPSDPNNIAL